MAIRYDENTKARAVRLVREHRDGYDSEWAAMRAISGRLGMSPETPRKWVRQAVWDTTITEILAGYFEPDAEGKRPPESLYGSLKMWAHLQRQNIRRPAARWNESCGPTAGAVAADAARDISRPSRRLRVDAQC